MYRKWYIFIGILLIALVGVFLFLLVILNQSSNTQAPSAKYLNQEIFLGSTNDSQTNQLQSVTGRVVSFSGEEDKPILVLTTMDSFPGNLVNRISLTLNLIEKKTVFTVQESEAQTDYFWKLYTIEELRNLLVPNTLVTAQFNDKGTITSKAILTPSDVIIHKYVEKSN